MPTGQLPYPLIDTVRGRDVAVSEILFEREAGKVSRAARMFAERRQLACETKSVSFMEKIERFFPKPIPGSKQTTSRTIVENESPHAVQPVEQRIAPSAVAVKQDLRIAVVGLEGITKCLQFRA